MPLYNYSTYNNFRDPKVMWHDETRKWIMTLATLDRVTFYSSPDLKTWTKESEFGKEAGAHGGVWECPDLFPLEHEGKKVWVLLVSINPGGPNGGSATQYFTGDFDGQRFTPHQTTTRWIDYGPDNYAGITWANTGNRKIFLGWMSNWQYAQVVPTQNWRSAMTIPRDLGLHKINDSYLVTSKPVQEITQLAGEPVLWKDIQAMPLNLTEKTGDHAGPSRIVLTSGKVEDFALTLSSNSGHKVVVGYDESKNEYFIDRTHSGTVDFEKGFPARHTAPRLAAGESMDLTLILDKSSVEFFADGGLSVMTQIFFPDTWLSQIAIDAKDGFRLQTLEYTPLKSIHK